ncbi:ABC transporter substrate-binding protein [Nostoc sp. NMS8]|uniref:ABC transporter substrate-binding protein n=1 Tax=Nostoc sp. NMS8 TaxID=2815392 RepID=UPI0025E8FE72|nr:ABC transporter substrate-binding protein [Nostoc sp. NMS8]MBN3962527.1 ABC transporter substrate-binding protein [Nostoc sp. NMS8]
MSLLSNLQRSLYTYVLLGLLTFIVVACSASSQQVQSSATEPIYIGVSGPLTGNNAQYGAQWKKGFDLALDEINGAGGIKGRKLAYIFEDSQSDPKQSVVIAQKFVADPKIVIELGDFSSPASMAASPIYQRNKLVQFGFTNSHPDFTKGGDYIWSNAVSQKDGAPLHANYIQALGLKRIAVFHLNTDWGKTSYDLFAQRAKENGIEILFTEPYLADEKDFRTSLTRVRETKPDGIALISYYSDAALIIQQARSLGINLPIVTTGSNHSPKFLELGGKAVEGIYLTSNFSPFDSRPEVREYLKKFDAKYHEEPDSFAVHAYDTIKLVAAAIELGGPDRTAIKESLGKLKDVPSVIYGKVTFNPETRRAVKPVDRRLIIKDGKFVLWDGKKLAQAMVQVYV